MEFLSLSCSPVLPCETSQEAGSKEERLFSQTIASIASVSFLKNNSAVLVAKVQDMTDRYDVTNLQK